MLRRSNVAPVERIPNPIQEQSAPVRLCQAAGKLLQATAAISSLRPQALDLARELIDHVLPGQWLDICQEAALAGLKDKDAQTRAQAVHLVLHLARRTDAAAEVTLLAGIRHVLTDQEPLVRRAAVIALAPSRQAISDDDLLPVLHDSDPEVRRLAELALRSRGLEEGHLRLARLISDPSPGERLQVVDHLDRTSGLEPGVWLLRLSHDAVPAVRAAAVRAACCRPQVNLQERMRKIARDDPSPTVRQLARYYLDRPTAIHD
jgi:HEAT repeat protein